MSATFIYCITSAFIALMRLGQRSSVNDRLTDYDDYDRIDRSFDRPSRDSETDHDKYLDYYGDYEQYGP